MSDFFEYLLQSDFMPHGHCYMWKPDILWMHVVSDIVIALAYYSIPIALFYFVRKRHDLKYKSLFILFAAFILLCGTTHIMGVWSVWHGTYRLSGSIKAATALVSLATAVVMWPIIPKALRIPSPTQLAETNASLLGEIEDRKKAEAELQAYKAELEQKVRERTAALESLNQQLQKEVAQRKQQAEQLQRYTRDLERSNQELDAFAHVASHDLRAPLRAIKSLAQWIDEDNKEVLPESSQADLQLLQERADRMRHLLDGLLTYARAGRTPDTIETVHTRALVDDVVDLLPLPPAFRVTVADDLPVLETAKLPLEQVFLNLLSNGIKHHDKEEGHLTVTATQNDGWVAFSVTDDGPGISPEFRARIFDMFSMLKSQDEVEGSGLGLALVKKIVERYGGTITVSDPPEGHGSCFMFTWPLVLPTFSQGG